MPYDLTTTELLYNLFRTNMTGAGEVKVCFKGDQNVKNRSELGMISIDHVDTEYDVKATTLDKKVEIVRITLTIDKLNDRGNPALDENTVKTKLEQIFEGEQDRSYHPESIMGILRVNLSLINPSTMQKHADLIVGRVNYPPTDKNASNELATATLDLTVDRRIGLLRDS